MNRKNNNLCCGSTKVGSRGQVVIPQDVREKLGIKEGDILLVVSNGSNVKLVKQEVLAKLVED